jgi:hypothetical protein
LTARTSRALFVKIVAVDGVDETEEFDNFLLYMDWAKFYDSISKSDIELCLRARKVPELVIALIFGLGLERTLVHVVGVGCVAGGVSQLYGKAKR